MITNPFLEALFTLLLLGGLASLVYLWSRREQRYQNRVKARIARLCHPTRRTRHGE